MDDLSNILNTGDTSELIKLSQKKLEVLNDGLSSLTQTEVDRLGKFAWDVLNKLTSSVELGGVEKTQISEILEGVLLCSDCVEKCQTKLKKPLSLEKAIFSFTSTLYKQEFRAECYRPAKYLYPRLLEKQPAHPESVQNMSHNLHVYLWNGSVKMSAGNHDQFQLIFCIRTLAILYCIMGGPKPMTSVLEKVSYGLERMECSLKKVSSLKKNKEITASVGKEYEDYCSDVCDLFFKIDQAMPKENEDVPMTYCNLDLLNLGVFVDSIARFLKFKYLKMDCKDTTFVSRILHAYKTHVEGMERLHELKEFLHTILNDLEATLTVSTAQVLASAHKLAKFVKSSTDVAQKVILTRIALIHQRHFMLYYRGQANQNLSSIGVAQTAYSDLTAESQIHVEEIHKVAVLMLGEAFAAIKKAKKDNSAENLAKDRIYLDLVMFQSDLIYAMAGRLKRDKTLSKGERLELVERCGEESEALSKVLKSIKWAETTVMTVSEHKHFGYLQFRVGRSINEAVSAKLAIPHCKLGVEHYKIYSPKATKEEKQKQPLYIRYEVLVTMQRKAGLYEDALKTACEILLVNKAGLTSACENWHHVKQSIITQRGIGDKLVKRTMWQEVMSICIGSGQKCNWTPEEIFKAELTEMREKNAPAELQIWFIEKYLQVTRSQQVKARLLLLKASNAWVTRNSDYGDPESLIQEALTIMKSCDPEEKTYQDNLASAHLMLYIVKDIDVTQMEKVRLEQIERKKKKKQVSAGGQSNQSDELEQAELFNNCITLAEETELMAPCISALESWEKVAESGMKTDRFLYMGESALALLTLAQIFRIRDWTTHEARALHLAIAASKLAKYDETTLETMWLLCRLFVRTMQPQVAVAMAEEAESWLAGLGELAQTDARAYKPYLDMLGVKAEALLLQNKLEKGYSVLKQAFALKQESFSARCRNDLLLDGYLCRIQARFLSLPHSFWSQGAPEEAEIALELTTRATRSVGGVVTSSLGESFINCSERRSKTSVPLNVVEKWSLIDQLLECYYEAGSVYIQMGDARESTIYIEQGILIARTFNLPKRRAMFHLLDARLNNISEKFSESAAHLHSVSYLFNSNTTSKRVIKDVSSASSETSTDKQGGQSPEAFQIQTMNLEFEDHVTMDADSRPTEKTASPKHKREQTGSLAFLNHGSHCTCSCCHDVAAVKIGLYYSLCCGEMFVMQGKYGEGKERLNGLMTRARGMTSKAVTVLEGVVKKTMSSVGKGKKKQSKEIKPHVFQEITVEACKLMTYLSLIDLDLKAHQEWTLKLNSCLQLESSPWAVNAWVDMAESKHLSVAPSVPYPSMETSWQLDDLCQQIDTLNMKVAPKMIDGCATPVASKVDRILTAKAPVKRRKGLLGLMEEADNEGAVRKPPATCGGDPLIAGVSDNGGNAMKEKKILAPKKTVKGKTPHKPTTTSATGEKASSKSIAEHELLTSKKTAGKKSTRPIPQMFGVNSSSSATGDVSKSELTKASDDNPAKTTTCDRLAEHNTKLGGDKQALDTMKPSVDSSRQKMPQAQLAPKMTSKNATKSANAELQVPKTTQYAGINHKSDSSASELLASKKTSQSASKMENTGMKTGSDCLLQTLVPESKEITGFKTGSANSEIPPPEKISKGVAEIKNVGTKTESDDSKILAPRSTSENLFGNIIAGLPTGSDVTSKILVPKKTSKNITKVENTGLAIGVANGAQELLLPKKTSKNVIKLEKAGPTTGVSEGSQPELLVPKRTARNATRKSSSAMDKSPKPVDETSTLAPKRTARKTTNATNNSKGCSQDKTELKRVATKPSKSKDPQGKTAKAPVSTPLPRNIASKGGKFEIYVDDEMKTVPSVPEEKENKLEPKSTKKVKTTAKQTALAHLIAELSESEDESTNLKGKQENSNAKTPSIAKLLAEMSDSDDVLLNTPNAKQNKAQKKGGLEKSEKVLTRKLTSKRQPRTKNDQKESVVLNTLKADQTLTNGALPMKSPLKALFKDVNGREKNLKDIFEFDCSTPEVTPVKQKKPLKKVATSRSKRQTTTVKSMKENEEKLSLSLANLNVTEEGSMNGVNTSNQGLIMNEDNNSGILQPKRTRGAAKTKENNNTTTRTRITRSRTIKEDQRFDSDECSDEIVMDLDVSVVMDNSKSISSPGEAGGDRWFDEFYIKVEEDDGYQCEEVNQRDGSLADLSGTMVHRTIRPVECIEEVQSDDMAEADLSVNVDNGDNITAFNAKEEDEEEHYNRIDNIGILAEEEVVVLMEDSMELVRGDGIDGLEQIHARDKDIEEVMPDGNLAEDDDVDAMVEGIDVITGKRPSCRNLDRMLVNDDKEHLLASFSPSEHCSNKDIDRDILDVKDTDADECEQFRTDPVEDSEEEEFDEPELERMDEQNESKEDIFCTTPPKYNEDAGGVEMPRKTLLKVKGQTVQPVATSENSVSKSLINVDQKHTALLSPTQGMRSLRVGSIKQGLLSAFNLLRGKPPSVPYRQVCHALATLAISEGGGEEVVYYMTESQSIVFRHRALMNVAKRTRKMEKEVKGNPDVENVNNLASGKEKLKLVTDTLEFTKDLTDIDKAIDILPTGWSVCQLTVMKRPSQEVGDLYVVNIVRGQPIIVQKMPGYSTSAGQEVLTEFGEIMRGNIISMHLKDRQDWWNTRIGLDNKIMKVVEKISSVWLGGGQCLLHGTPVSEATVQRIEEALTEICTQTRGLLKLTTDKRRLLKLLLQSCHLLKDREVLEVLCEVAGRLEAAVMDTLLREVKRVNKELDIEKQQLQPVILILDRTIQQLPWENLHFLKQRPVSRIPNLYFLELLLRQQRDNPTSVYNTGMDPSDTFYVLNPDANLAGTQLQFEEMFRNKPGWKGTIGTVPTVDQVKQALCNHDLYVYCGHGGGNRYVSGDTLATFECRACVTLMGCSSGKLIVNGKLDAYGLMLNYFLAGCPCIIANLWDVTDKDIDRLTEKLLNDWTDAKDGSLITEPLEASRQVCRLKGLIGMAPAVYGIPLRIQRKQKPAKND